MAKQSYFRLAKVVAFAQSSGRAKKNGHLLKLARERGVAIEALTLHGGKTDGKRKVYFGRALTPEEVESLTSSGMQKNAQGWVGFKNQIPQWVWDMKKPVSPRIGAKPRAAKDLVWEPGKKSWP